MEAVTADLLRTRNGKPKACEPCRRRKTACDHTLPICTQCVQRNVPQYCVYMFPRSKAAQVRSDGLPENAQDTAGEISIPSPTPAGCTPMVDQFFGPTSFFAAFDDADDGFECPQPETPISTDRLAVDAGASLPPDLFALASKVLTQFPDAKTCLWLFGRYRNPNDNIIRPALDQVLKSFWAYFGTDLRRGKASSIRRIAEVISRNTSIALEDDADGLERWMRSTSQQMIRWEAIGIILCHLSYGIISSGGEDFFLVEQDGSEKDRETMLKEIRECVTICVRLCRYYPRNTLLAYLGFKHLVIEGIVAGDTSKISPIRQDRGLQNLLTPDLKGPTVWVLHGELIATVTAMGMHKENAASKMRTDLSIEVRRRVFASIFVMDKILATFLGRPPLMSHRFTSTLPPLDISDEALLNSDSINVSCIERLEDGWCVNGKFNPGAMLRARHMLGVVSSAILDEALSESSLVNRREVLIQLRERCKTLYSSLPHFLIFRLEDYANSESPMIENFHKYDLRLEYLRNLLLLEQLISKHEQLPSQELFDVAREMLSLVLLFWNHRDRFVEVSMGVSWLILNFAVSASGALCTELLRQSRSLEETSRAWIPRTETIQNLNILVTFLDWVPLSAPNASVCRKMRHRIGGILNELQLQSSTGDETLPEQGAMPLDLFGYGTASDFTDFDYLVDLNSVDLFNWMSY